MMQISGLPGLAADEARLCCVALPVLGRDIGPVLEQIFALWDDPRFLPGPLSTGAPHLLLVANNASPETLAEARKLFAAYPRMAACFSGFSAHSAGLEGDRDLYARDSPKAMGAFGNKAGPNFLFQTTMHLAGVHGGWVLQIETDCLPVQAGWLEATQAVITGGSRAWVIGAIFAGESGLDRSIQTHLNGNALYKAGDPAFLRFLDEVWMASLMANVQERPNVAYDCWWAMETARANANSGNRAWWLYQTYDSFFRNDPFIVNHKIPMARADVFVRAYDKFTALGRSPVFFHGEAMRGLLPQLIAHPVDNLVEAIDRLAPPEEARARAWMRAQMHLVDRIANAEAGAADRLLISCASALLLEPLVTLDRLLNVPDLWRAIKRAQLIAAPPTTAHFARVLAMARDQRDESPRETPPAKAEKARQTDPVADSGETRKGGSSRGDAKGNMAPPDKAAQPR